MCVCVSVRGLVARIPATKQTLSSMRVCLSAPSLLEIFRKKAGKRDDSLIREKSSCFHNKTAIFFGSLSAIANSREMCNMRNGAAKAASHSAGFIHLKDVTELVFWKIKSSEQNGRQNGGEGLLDGCGHPTSSDEGSSMGVLWCSPLIWKSYITKSQTSSSLTTRPIKCITELD